MINIDDIAVDVISRLDHEDLEYIRNHKRDSLALFHHGLGTWIRNTYHLWENEWTPVIKDGVDYAEDHPDAISMKIIERIWDFLQNLDEEAGMFEWIDSDCSIGLD